jgi:hypothetical protein
MRSGLYAMTPQERSSAEGDYPEFTAASTVNRRPELCALRPIASVIEIETAVEPASVPHEIEGRLQELDRVNCHVFYEHIRQIQDRAVNGHPRSHEQVLH